MVEEHQLVLELELHPGSAHHFHEDEPSWTFDHQLQTTTIARRLTVASVQKALVLVVRAS